MAQIWHFSSAISAASSEVVLCCGCVQCRGIVFDSDRNILKIAFLHWLSFKSLRRYGGGGGCLLFFKGL